MLVRPRVKADIENIADKGIAEGTGNAFLKILGGAMEFFNMMMILGSIQGMINSAVAAVQKEIGTGFQNTLYGISNISHASHAYYVAEYNDFDEQMKNLEADLDCSSAWDEFNKGMSTIMSDYDKLQNAFHICKTVHNYTGVQYADCEYENAKHVNMDHFSIYKDIANFDPSFSWKQSRSGQFIYYCSKKRIVSSATCREPC